MSERLLIFVITLVRFTHKIHAVSFLFTAPQMRNGTWLLQLSVDEEASGPIPNRGPVMSVVQVCVRVCVRGDWLRRRGHARDSWWIEGG